MRLALLLGALLPLAAGANPTGGTTASGSATMSTSGSTLTVNTSTSSTIINWASFSIAAGETTRVNQPSAQSVTLNRVTGPSSSSIQGSLQSNGQIFLSNPNGIVIGPTASINVAGFVGSTLDIADADFLAGNLHFAVNGAAGSLVNQGTIVASSYYIALIAPNIQSSGTLQAGPAGIALAGGDPVTLSLAPGFVLSNVTVGSNLGGTATMQVSGTISPTNTFIMVDGTVTFSPGGGSLHPRAVPPQPTIVNPGTLTINQNSGTSGGTISWTNFAIGSGGNVGTGSAINLTVPGSGNVQIYGTLTAAAAPATTGLAVNLEKREVGF